MRLESTVEHSAFHAYYSINVVLRTKITANLTHEEAKIRYYCMIITERDIARVSERKKILKKKKYYLMEGKKILTQEPDHFCNYEAKKIEGQIINHKRSRICVDKTNVLGKPDLAVST